MDPKERPWWRLPGRDPLTGRSFHESPTFAADSFADDVRWQLERLRGAGLEQALVTDLTRDEWQVPVVRVIVPGLEYYCTHGSPCLPGRRALRMMMRQP
jgi:ribosomal protein S12 methylthiotransferase accessory factor